MIYKIDHLAFGTNQFENDIRSLVHIGYKPTFIERKATNMDNTKNLMQPFSVEFNFSLCDSPGNIGIEVLDYGHVNKPACNAIPIFENLSSENVDTLGTVIFDDTTYNKGILKGLKLPVYYRETKQPNVCFDKIILKTRDVYKSAAFWEVMRFKIIRIDPDFACLEFTSLFPKKTTYLYLERQNTPDQPCLLDSKGFNKIALISDSAETERQILCDKGYYTTSIDRLSANNKTLNIFFSYGPSGELAEIVSLQK